MSQLLFSKSRIFLGAVALSQEPITGKVKPDVVNCLLESLRFATVIYMIAQYLDDTLVGGFAAQNQMLASISSMLLAENKTPAAVKAAREVNACKVSMYQAELTNIQNT